MKHLIWLLFLFTFFLTSSLFAQIPSTVALVSKEKANPQVVAALPIASSFSNDGSYLPMPILKLPESFDKKYLIRVHQSEKPLFKKFLKDDLPIGLKYHRGFDHKGYDYFLPVAFDKEHDAVAFLAQLKDPIFSQAVVVKNVPRNVWCNCINRF